MLKKPMDVLTLFPVRKSKAQKTAFREAVCSYAQALGYSSKVEQGLFGSRNLILGDSEKAKFLVTAHYDTCARMLIPNFCTPCNLFVYVLYQLVLIMILGIAAIIAGCIAGFLLTEAAVKPLIFLVFFSLLILLMVGPANKNNANDNTSGVVTLLEIARTLPENQRHKVCFVLFDLEEAGLIGSSSYRKLHKKATDTQLVLNLDCVGEGDKLLMFPTKLLKNNLRKRASLYRACGYFGKKSLLLWEKGKALYASDQLNFPYGVGICALKQRKNTLYLSKIHTHRDTVLDETNVNILRAALTTFICCDEVN